MKDTEAKRGVLIAAFAGNFMLTLFRLVSLRIIYLTSRHSDIAIFVRLLSIIPMILITFFTFSLLGYFADRRNLKFRGDQYAKYKKYLKGSGKAMIFFIALTAAFVLFCGVLSVIIYSLLENIMSYDFIKNTIDVLTGVITLLISPFALMQMLSLLITGLPLRRAALPSRVRNLNVIKKKPVMRKISFAQMAETAKRTREPQRRRRLNRLRKKVAIRQSACQFRLKSRPR